MSTTAAVAYVCFTFCKVNLHITQFKASSVAVISNGSISGKIMNVPSAVIAQGLFVSHYLLSGVLERFKASSNKESQVV